MTSFALAVAALFGAGVVGALSPCVLPLVPGYLAVLTDSAHGTSRWLRVAVFAAGAVVTFAVMGSFVAGAGTAVDTSRRLQVVSGVVLLVCAAGLLAARSGRVGWQWRIPLPLPSSPLLRAVALGVGCGAAWSPCVGPLLGAALTAAGGSGSVWRGAVLLAAFGAGVVLPMVGVAVLPTRRVPVAWRRAGRLTSAVAPMVLLALGVVLVAGWYPALVQRLPTGT